MHAARIDVEEPCKAWSLIPLVSSGADRSSLENSSGWH